MEDFMASIPDPAPNKTVVISLESDSDDDIDVEEVSRLLHWQAELQRPNPAKKPHTQATPVSPDQIESPPQRRNKRPTDVYDAEDDELDATQEVLEPTRGVKRLRSLAPEDNTFEELNPSTEHQRSLHGLGKRKTQRRLLTQLSNLNHDGNATSPHTAHNQPRIPWTWSSEKTSAVYVPVYKDKWWSNIMMALPIAPMALPNALKNKASHETSLSHIGRIMETELGEELTGNDRCNNCQKHDWECWVYTERGAKQILGPGVRCARCRFNEKYLKECCFLITWIPPPVPSHIPPPTAKNPQPIGIDHSNNLPAFKDPISNQQESPRCDQIFSRSENGNRKRASETA